MLNYIQLIASLYRENYTLSLVIIVIAKVVTFIKIHLVVITSLNIHAHIVQASK